VPAALGKGTIALGKGFAECRTGFFVECLLSGTRQRLCRVSSRRHSAKKSYRYGGYKLTVALSSVSKKGTWQRIFLKKIPNFFADFFKKFFAKCLQTGHSAKKLIFFI